MRECQSNLGRNVRRLRQIRAWPQGELCDKLNAELQESGRPPTHQVVISRIETMPDNLSVRQDVLVSMSRVFCVSLNELFSGTA